MINETPATVRPTMLLISDLVGFRPRWLATTFLLMLGRSVSEGIGLIMLVPLLSMANLGSGGDPVTSMSQGPSWLLPLLPVKPTVELMMGVFLTLILIRAVLGYASAMAGQRFQAGFAEHIRWRLYRSNSRASWMFLAGTQQSLEMHALTEQTDDAAAAAHYVLSLAASILTMLTGVSVAFMLSAWLTLYVLAGGLLLSIPLAVFQRLAFVRAAQSLAATNSLYDVLVARLNGIKLAKAFAIEEELEKDFSAASEAYRQAELKAHENSARARLFQDCAMAALLTFMVYVALVLLQVPQLELILLIVIFARLAPLAAGIAHNLHSLVGCLPSYAALRAREAAALAAAEDIPTTASRIELRESIALKGVKFAYPDDPDRLVLNDVSVTLAAGSATSVVGLSGAGKSTLADIVAGLQPPDAGGVFVDGEKLDAARRAQWRASVAYVPQDAPLFHGTLRENLRIGARAASEAEIWEALEIVQAAVLVRGLPDELETMAGERGVRLSGGEQQRIRLASALLRRPELLILDESTSALNPDDEAEIVSGLRRRYIDMTVLLVAHRASSIGWTDRVVLLRDGKIDIDGPPVDILAQLNTKADGLHDLVDEMEKKRRS